MGLEIDIESKKRHWKLCDKDDEVNNRSIRGKRIKEMREIVEVEWVEVGQPV